jgi:transcriptional regulator of NAD metabolism
MDGSERRDNILEIIASEGQPVSASALASRLGVSRQVIVSDIAILRVVGHNITATARGYMMERQSAGRYVGRVAVKHPASKTRNELSAIVRTGCVIIDVTVTHPYYGDLTGSLNIATLSDVDDFIRHIEKRKGKMLCELTGGVHIHTLSCAGKAGFDAAVAELSRMGMLISAAD